MEAPDINFIITKGGLYEKLQYSLFKLLDWNIGNAVCVTLMPSKNFILIHDCARNLRDRLTEKFGERCGSEAKSWGCEASEVNIYDVIKEVTEWVNEQE